jgi:hypothetical protein
LPLSEDMLRLASGGVFCLNYPDHPLTREVRRVAEKLA